MANRTGGDDGVHSITAASRPHSEDLDRRMRRYLISMSTRTVCILLVLVVHHPIRWVFAAGAVVLPYVAVVLANAGIRRTGDRPETVDRLALTGTSMPTQRARTDG